MQDHESFAIWLLNEKVLSKEDLRRARDAQRGRMGNLDTEIIDLGLLTEAETLDALGRFHRTRTVSGFDLELASTSAIRMLTPRIASRLGVVPFKLEGRTLSVATLNPGDLLVEDEIAQLTGCLVASFVTLEIRFVEALNRHYQAPITARYAGLIRRLSGGAERVVVPSARSRIDEAESGPVTPPVEAPASAPVVRRSRTAPKHEEALELSADERDLFPSLSRADDGATEDGPQPEPTAPRSPTEPADEAPSVAVERRSARDRAAMPPVPAEATEIGPDTLLQAASHAMQNVEMRDDIADAVLGFSAPLFKRRMMLVMRKGTIMGWRGEGLGVEEQAVRAISLPADEPSVFSGLLQGVDFWLGPLPTMPHNTELVLALGGAPPKDCYILPVKVRDRVVCFLYGDNMGDGVGGLPLAELKRLAGKAGLAFQIYLIKGKIRAV